MPITINLWLIRLLSRNPTFGIQDIQNAFAELIKHNPPPPGFDFEKFSNSSGFKKIFKYHETGFLDPDL
jgi:hypothetical protein